MATDPAHRTLLVRPPSDPSSGRRPLLRGRGLTVLTTPVGEFEKLGGSVTCLSVRVH